MVRSKKVVRRNVISMLTRAEGELTKHVSDSMSTLPIPPQTRDTATYHTTWGLDITAQGQISGFHNVR